MQPNRHADAYLHQYSWRFTGLHLQTSGLIGISTSLRTYSQETTNMKIPGFITTLALLLPVSVIAAPTLEQRWSSPAFWASHSGHVPSSRRGCDYALCDLSKARMPQGTTTCMLNVARNTTNRHASSDTTATTILQFDPESCLYRAWHAELHLRPFQQYRNPCSYRSNGISLQCILHRR